MNFLSSEHIRDYPGGEGAEPEPREEQHLGQGRQVASLNAYLIRITYRTQLLYNVCLEYTIYTIYKSLYKQTADPSISTPPPPPPPKFVTNFTFSYTPLTVVSGPIKGFRVTFKKIKIKWLRSFKRGQYWYIDTT